MDTTVVTVGRGQEVSSSLTIRAAANATLGAFDCYRIKQVAFDGKQVSTLPVTIDVVPGVVTVVPPYGTYVEARQGQRLGLLLQVATTGADTTLRITSPALLTNCQNAMVGMTDRVTPDLLAMFVDFSVRAQE